MTSLTIRIRRIHRPSPQGPPLSHLLRLLLFQLYHPPHPHLLFLLPIQRYSPPLSRLRSLLSNQRLQYGQQRLRVSVPLLHLQNDPLIIPLHHKSLHRNQRCHLCQHFLYIPQPLQRLLCHPQSSQLQPPPADLLFHAPLAQEEAVVATMMMTTRQFFVLSF